MVSFVCFLNSNDDMNAFFFFQAEDGIRDKLVTGVQTCALPILRHRHPRHRRPERSEGARPPDDPLGAGPPRGAGDRHPGLRRVIVSPSGYSCRSATTLNAVTLAPRGR